ncbi:LOW QUALITY PROTEIN: major intrinsically disordered Notch2-binding receptor 1-like, partial [Perognathus longimembris pacificus]|uniref:LOW QUALITY PROTEIN: major intrinsically disordered Notch2-binding receptor 1-like n=1 Tax=Perognathus longimembris pacificus TaxID=214514 RepID=UPI00201865AD
MEATQETSLFLEKILEELDRKQGTVDYQELCASLCARLDLAQLARLRGALLYTACLDPGFPASLFKDREACAGGPRATKLAVAADIVAIFHLAQAGGAAGGGQQGSQKGAAEPGERPLGRGLPARRPAARQKADRPECVPASEPGFSLGVRKEAKHRAASLDRLPAGAPFPGAGPPPCEMQRTRFPMHLDGESVSDRDSPPVGPALRDAFLPHDEGPFLGPPRGPERSAFQGDFPLLVAASPAAGRPGRGAEPPRRKEPPRAPFFNHSFEMPGPGPYLSPGYSPGPGRRRAKHESLEDLQASTYFGPTAPAPGARDARRGPGRPSRQTPWPAKSWSLTAEDGPGFEGAEATPPFPGSGSQTPGLSAPEGRPAFLGPEEPQRILPAGYRAAVKPGGPGAKEKPTAPDPGPREAGPKFQDKSAGGAGRQLSSDTSSVGTQTEQPAPRPPRRPDPGEPLARKPSDDSSEGVSDDISDIFRFLDDSGLVQSSCYNSTGSLSQLHRSDGDSSPERPRAQVADGAPGGRGEDGRGPDRARPSEEELKTSVCQLVLRIGEIERKLESLSGVREEISQVLGKLNKLDQKMQRPDVLSVQVDLNSLASEVPSEDGTSPGAFRARRGARGPPPDGDDWCCSEASGGHGESLRVRALKKSL